eukprot:m.483135 g.483135  ORF g.483135 m.483135 type:complete len:1213 (-) comp22795_c0_seq1:125-3763(-)
MRAWTFVVALVAVCGLPMCGGDGMDAPDHQPHTLPDSSLHGKSHSQPVQLQVHDGTAHEPPQGAVSHGGGDTAGPSATTTATTPMAQQPNCGVHRVGYDVYDLRALTGSYVVSNDDDKFRYSLCETPPRCNHLDNVAVCNQHGIAEGLGLAAVFEMPTGLLPAQPAVDPATDSLKLIYRGGYMRKVLDEFATATDFLSGVIDHEFPNTSIASELDAMLDSINSRVQRANRATEVLFVCDEEIEGEPELNVRGSWVQQDDGADNTTTTVYGLSLTHKCACRNATCPPKQKEQREMHCPEAGTLFWQLNVPAIVVIAMLWLFERRRDWFRSWFGGFGGIPVPINFLYDRTSSRFVGMLTFAAISSVSLSDLVVLLRSTATSSSPMSHDSVLNAMLLMLFLAVNFYPIALCTKFPNAMIGSLFGFTYCTWMTVTHYEDVACKLRARHVTKFAADSPTLVCLALLALWFFGYFVHTCIKVGKCLLKRQRSASRRRRIPLGFDILLNMQVEKETDTWKFYQERVREIMAPRKWRLSQAKATSFTLEKGLWWVLSKLGYHNYTHFRYSGRVLCLTSVALLLIYEAVLLWTIYCRDFANFVHRVLNGLYCQPASVMVSLDDIPVPWFRGSPLLQIFPGIQLHADVKLSCRTTNIIREAVFYSFMASGVISGILHAVFLLHMVTCYRKHVIRLCRGQRAFLPKTSYKSSVAIVDGLKYAGYQTAYLLVGFAIVAFVWCFVCLFIALTIVLPILDIYDDPFWKPVLLPRMYPVLVSVGVWAVQYCLVRFVFQVDGGYTIRNLRVFHNFDFFIFFVNVFLGLYSFVLRICGNLVATLLWISRLDKNMMPRGYEYWDPGYRTYVGFLLLDYHYSNPIAMTFTQQLFEAIDPDPVETQLRALGSRRQSRDDGTPTNSVGHHRAPSDADVVPLLRRVSSWIQLPTPVLQMVTTETTAGNAAVFVDPAAPALTAAALAKRRKTLRNRWWLYITLYYNPHLRNDRKRSARRRMTSILNREEANKIWKLQQKLLDGGTCPVCGERAKTHTRSWSTSSEFDAYGHLMDGNAHGATQNLRRRSSVESLHVRNNSFDLGWTADDFELSPRPTTPGTAAPAFTFQLGAVSSDHGSNTSLNTVVEKPSDDEDDLFYDNASDIFHVQRFVPPASPPRRAHRTHRRSRSFDRGHFRRPSDDGRPSLLELEEVPAEESSGHARLPSFGGQLDERPH